MVLSIGFRSSVSFPPAIQATGLLTLTPAGLPPAEHASLSWTRGLSRRYQGRCFDHQISAPRVLHRLTLPSQLPAWRVTRRETPYNAAGHYLSSGRAPVTLSMILQ